MNTVDVDRFWACCAGSGIVSKQLSLKSIGPSPRSYSLAVIVDEKVKYGSPVVSVPYNFVLNRQTLRGDLLPRCLPPFSIFSRFMTRRGRLDVLSVHSLWLAAFVACYRKDVSWLKSKWGKIADEERSLEERIDSVRPLAPLMGDTVHPLLPPMSSPDSARLYPCLCPSLSSNQLNNIHKLAESHAMATHSVVTVFAKRQGIARCHRPSLDEVAQAYRTVMQRSLPLPVNCEPSAPADLGELIAASPDLPLLPSLIPVVDLIRPASLVEDGTSNCSIHTCIQADFLNSSTRRRAVVETNPLSARRVVVCATKDLKQGDELLIGLE